MSKKTAKKYLKIKLVRSTNKKLAVHKACVKGLGLRALGHTVEVEDTPAVRGMINKAHYLLQIVEEK
jgi:large subunit ribosomal protein L30